MAVAMLFGLILILAIYKPLSVVFCSVLCFFAFLNRRAIANCTPSNPLTSRPNLFCGAKYSIAFVVLSIHKLLRERQNRLSAVDFASQLLPSKSEENAELFRDISAWKGTEYSDTINFQGCDTTGNAVYLTVTRQPSGKCRLALLLRVQKNGELAVFRRQLTSKCQVANEGFRFSVEGLTIELREPMMRWRLTFAGWLTESTGTRVYCQLAFMWHCLSDPVYLSCIHPRMAAHYFAKQTFQAFWRNKSLLYGQEHYVQVGQLTAAITIDDVHIPMLRLRGNRARSQGLLSKRFSISGYFESGDHINFYELAGDDYRVGTGSVALNESSVQPMSQCTLTESGYQTFIEQLSRARTPGLLSFEADSRHYGITARRCCDDNGTGVSLFEFQKGSTGGLGFLERSGFEEQALDDVVKGGEPLEQQSYSSLHPLERRALVVPLRSRAAKCVELTGGKSSHLAQLVEVSNFDWMVPDGACVTVNAFAGDPSVGHGGNGSGIDVRTKLEGELAETLSKVFGTAWMNMVFAVRSSAVGEDSETASAAGQMDTILNVSGLANLRSAIFMCYESSFSSEISTYSAQRQSAIEAAVLVQEMVPSEKSGVVFTCNPLTGNRSEVIINASYGLGESVVSGSIEPDSVTVRRTFSGDLKITQINVGGTGKVVLADGSNPDSRKQDGCCMSEDEILMLARSCLEIESLFGSPRDVEWAFHDGRLYILQARPISTLRFETEFEQSHEFDVPIRNDHDYLTTANVGEVLSGPLSPLGLSTIVSTISKSSQLHTAVFTDIQLHKFAPLGFCVDRHHLLFNMHQVFYKNPLPKINRHTLELCMLGRPVEDEALDRQMERRLQQNPKLKPIVDIFNMYRTLFREAGKLWNETEFVEAMEFPKHLVCSKDIFAELMHCHKIAAKVTLTHMQISGRSSVFYQFPTSILYREETGFPAFNADVARLYSSCEGVVSASVPRDLESFANLIKDVSGATGFVNMTPADAVIWLKSQPTLTNVFQDFMTKHGHRCIHEIDLVEQPWSENPSAVVDMLQRAALNPDQGANTRARQIPSPDEVIDSLSFQPTYGQRMFLRWLIPKARKAVGDREAAKSRLIKIRHVVRSGYKQLGDALVKERRISDADLVFYLTLYELHLLVDGRGGTVWERAQRRLRLRPRLTEIRIPDLCRGYPPLSVSESVNKDATVVHGTPVSLGKARGRVCVAKTLEAARDIRRGDILVARSTDIAWSIYFPLLAGVVTELGGLLSHGAVVAREYGLPCLVGASGVCDTFATGNNAFLDAYGGILQKVECDEDMQQRKRIG